MATAQILSVAVFVLVMLGIILEKLHRAVVALGGAILLILLGALSFEEGIGAVDFNTIGVLFGMMLFVSCCDFHVTEVLF